jgi:hypothetical protein
LSAIAAAILGLVWTSLALSVRLIPKPAISEARPARARLARLK